MGVDLPEPTTDDLTDYLAGLSFKQQVAWADRQLRIVLLGEEPPTLGRTLRSTAAEPASEAKRRRREYQRHWARRNNRAKRASA